MCIAIVCKLGYAIMNFEVNLIFQINPIFLYNQKVVTKTCILRTKRAFWMKYEGLQIKQITQFSLEGESPTLNGKYMSLVTGVISEKIQTGRFDDIFSGIFHFKFWRLLTKKVTYKKNENTASYQFLYIIYISCCFASAFTSVTVDIIFTTF